MRVTKSEQNYIKSKVEIYIGEQVNWRDGLIQETYIDCNYRSLEALMKILKEYNYCSSKNESIGFLNDRVK